MRLELSSTPKMSIRSYVLKSSTAALRVSKQRAAFMLDRVQSRPEKGILTEALVTPVPRLVARVCTRKRDGKVRNKLREKGILKWVTFSKAIRQVTQRGIIILGSTPGSGECISLFGTDANPT
jgi:hypothetical protein